MPTVCLLFLPAVLLPGAVSNADEVIFGRDIRPLLSDRCFNCHGPDREAAYNDLRLDKQEFATEYAIVPGDPESSAVLERISTDDESMRMPPPDSGRKPLTADEVALIKTWIESGAQYEEHWAFLPPQKSAVPEASDEQTSHVIDRFLRTAMKGQGLHPAPKADPRTLARRLHFDLLGLPPTPAEVEAFCADPSEQEYEAMVDKLLGSPHFGERMAQFWLDLVRYADTGGYHSDNEREVDAFRDYVIESFNENKPFDQFTIEQLAGDLLENPTLEQRIASGYNRLLQTTEEGGAQPKEYMAIYQADRVRNVSTVWLSLTMGCCQCHDHKFDPLATKDFYSLGAFFADIKEKPVGRQDPNLYLPTPEQQEQMAKLEAEIAAVRATPIDEEQLAAWTAGQEERVREEANEDTSDEKKSARRNRRKDDERLARLSEIVSKALEDRTEEDQQTIRELFKELSDDRKPVRDSLTKLQAQLDDVKSGVRTMLVAESVSPRTVRVLPRGNWMDDSGEVVQPAIPGIFGSLDVEGRRPTRMDLAEWIVEEDNPLTARVFVNRVWKVLFGYGLVRSLEDFGYQGDWPTHPELLDWLAVDFVEQGWDVKRLIEQIVMSDTYQQASVNVPESRQKDPFNRYLARQSRFRLSAEFIRDNALSASGLLVDEIGGPSVKPYQPAGYWQHLNFPVREWKADDGPNQYRRGLYTFWCRSFLHPSLLAFDASTREECTAERPRSNTPLQALVLLNDPTYVEAARVLAEKVCDQTPEDDARIDQMFWRVLQRSPTAEESAILKELLQQERTRYSEERDSAADVLKNGQAEIRSELPAEELAAWTAVARTVLNLHESLIRY